MIDAAKKVEEEFKKLNIKQIKIKEKETIKDSGHLLYTVEDWENLKCFKNSKIGVKFYILLEKINLIFRLKLKNTLEVRTLFQKRRT